MSSSSDATSSSADASAAAGGGGRGGRRRGRDDDDDYVSWHRHSIVAPLLKKRVRRHHSRENSTFMTTATITTPTTAGVDDDDGGGGDGRGGDFEYDDAHGGMPLVPPAKSTSSSSSLPSSYPPGHSTSMVEDARRTSSTRIAGHRAIRDIALSAAKERVRNARTVVNRSRALVEYAAMELDRSNVEFEAANESLLSLEVEWDVINVDDDDDDDNGSSRPSSPWSSSSMTHTSIERRHRECHEDETTSSGPPTRTTIAMIRVSDAGEDIVNGTYRRRRHPHRVDGSSSSHRTDASGPMYVRDGGPFVVRDAMHDVCIYARGGYGRRSRWCIALVPRGIRRACDDDDDVAVRDDDCIDDDDDDGDVGLESGRGWNFDVAYVYYWMEVEATDVDDATSLLRPSSSSKNNDHHRAGLSSSSSSTTTSFWGVCHGVRPIPKLVDATDGKDEARWYEFWKG